MRVALRRGCISLQRAGAIVTSANDSLCGNLQPEYWRFHARSNADSAVRAAGGAELEAACRALPAVDADVRRNLARWPGAVKRGDSAPVRCPTGRAVATPAFGALEADVVVHAVAPDVELSFGRYQGRNSYAPAGASDRDRLPEELLRGAYASAFAVAAARGAATVACPALGAGVKGWAAPVTAAFGLEAAARAPADLREIAFVLGEDAYAEWARVATTLLGAPDGGDELSWTIRPGEPDDAGDALPLRAKLAEFEVQRTLWATEAAGTRSPKASSWRWQPLDVRAVE